MTREELLNIIKHAQHNNVLNLSASQLTELPPEIGTLTHLTRLNLKHNKLKRLPREIFRLSNLQELWLDDNELVELPREIGELRKLKWLSASENQLKTLPAELSELPELEVLELSGNPMLPMPGENFSRRPADLIDFMLMQQEKRFINETKVMVLGNPGTGKTAVIRRMIERTFDPAEKSTKGINIQRWPFQVGHKRMQLNIWDFGRTETELNLHRFFMTPNTVYLLVWDAGEENNRAELQNWLKLIQFFGERSPVILLLNRVDRGVKELNRQHLQRQFPQIQEFINISASDGTGIHELRDALKKVLPQMPNMQTVWQPGWLNVKTRLEISRKDFIERMEFDQLCDREGLDAFSRETLLGWLNDLGVITGFQDDMRLSHLLVQRPGWLTEAVGRVLSIKTPFPNPGILKAKDIQQMIQPLGYSRSHLPFFIDLMKRFELCFDVEDETDRVYMVPHWLSDQSQNATWDFAHSLIFQYRYNFLPKNLVAKVVARLYPFIQPDTLWQNGFIVRDGNNAALVEMNAYDNSITFWVNGRRTTRRDFLSRVTAHFEYLHALFPMIEVLARVPLPDHPDIRLDYQHLLRMEENGETTIHPEGVDEPIRIDHLLNGFDGSRHFLRQRAGELQQQFEDLTRRVESFWLAYAKERDAQKLAEIETEIAGAEANRDAILGELQETENELLSI
ncbi:MAG: COR domain-containing protein [Calditrichia bacterium]|nr:hypothetical protein [Calditrichia bacterium]